MRKHMVLTVLAVAFSLLIGIQLVTTQVSANAIQADVSVNPDSLLLTEEGNQGKWITAMVKLPKGYDVNDINASSVTFKVAEIGQDITWSMYKIQGNILMAKFDRALLISLLWSMIEHMSPHAKQEVTLTVTGTLNDGSPFGGIDTIRVFFTQP